MYLINSNFNKAIHFDIEASKGIFTELFFHFVTTAKYFNFQLIMLDTKTLLSQKGTFLNNQIETILNRLGLNLELSIYIELLIFVTILLILCVITNYITKKIILNAVESFSKRSANIWDDIFVEEKVFRTLSHLTPAIIIEFSHEFIFRNFDFLIEYINRLTTVYIEIVVAATLLNIINALAHLFGKSESFKDKPIDSFQQLSRIIIFLVFGILIVAELMGINPGKILTGLGALTVIIMLVFKDTILGFVASIQMSSNDMLKIGDWIVFDKYGADGNVLELNLTTVKIQNWDKTISTIPTYSFISDAFKNWRGMEESGGRRIKRSISIDMTSIKFMDDTLTNKVSRFNSIKTYIESKKEELEKYNQLNKIDDSELVNGRRLTNIGTYRAYIEAYLKRNEKINKEMTFLVRHLQPNEKGLPIEIYVFANDKRWANYEAIQADIFDHLIAVIPEFELRVFQYPTNEKFKGIVDN